MSPPMTIIQGGISDWRPDRHITAHYGPRWKAVRYNGEQARAAWLRDEWEFRKIVAGLPDDAIIQCRLGANGRGEFRAKPQPT